MPAPTNYLAGLKRISFLELHLTYTQCTLVRVSLWACTPETCKKPIKQLISLTLCGRTRASNYVIKYAHAVKPISSLRRRRFTSWSSTRGKRKRVSVSFVLGLK